MLQSSNGLSYEALSTKIQTRHVKNDVHIWGCMSSYMNGTSYIHTCNGSVNVTYNCKMHLMVVVGKHLKLKRNHFTCGMLLLMGL